MGWKDWSHWLKGGIIGVSIYILFVILIFTVYQPLSGTAMGSDSLWILIIIGLPISSLIFTAFSPIVVFVLVLLQYFLIGALIGWIIKKKS